MEYYIQRLIYLNGQKTDIGTDVATPVLAVSATFS